MYVLGYDIGSSFVKATLVSSTTSNVLKVVRTPKNEMEIMAPQTGWAEQHPEDWWTNVCLATRQLLLETGVNPDKIQSIGIAYQMHGLVLVDEYRAVLRPSIIWCDSRAVEIGHKAAQQLGAENCLGRYLNTPGNFTASKLKWVKENEPEVYARIYKIMLPGDYIAMQLTGQITTTVSGLSEGVFWDFKAHKLAEDLLQYYGIASDLIPEIRGTFDANGHVTAQASSATGLREGTPVTYRAGDQPNNALSLGVIHPNEVAATGGTSGVIYGVTDKLIYDKHSRINGFAHVNHTAENPSLGLLLCINGAGIQYGWLKNQLAQKGTTYEDMEKMIAQIPPGSDGLRVLPFGNGAERMLGNRQPGAQVNNLQFNQHSAAHLFRAGLEGIAFSFVYGFQVLKALGMNPKVIKVGNDNLFQSKVFAQTIANLLNCTIQVIPVTGAAGAAKASGIAVGVYKDLVDAVQAIPFEKQYSPESEITEYEAAYEAWESDLKKIM